MTYENLLFETEGPVAVVTLNRPTRRNALSLALMRELLECLTRIGQERQLRAVILAAAGKVYSSGHDLSELVGRDINAYREIFDVCAELMTRIQSIPQPVIAEAEALAFSSMWLNQRGRYRTRPLSCCTSGRMSWVTSCFSAPESWKRRPAAPSRSPWMSRSE